MIGVAGMISIFLQSGIATSVNLRCYIFLHPTSSGFVSLRLPDMQLQMSWRMSEVTELLGSAEGDHDNTDFSNA